MRIAAPNASFILWLKPFCFFAPPLRFGAKCWVKLSAVTAPDNKNTRQKGCAVFGMVLPTLRCPAVRRLFYYFFICGYAILYRKNKKASSTFLARSPRRFILTHDCQRKNRLLPYAPPAVVLLHWHSPMSCFCVIPLLIASLCYTTQKQPRCVAAFMPCPSPFRFATL